MSSGEFSVSTAVALVLGGIAALLLATIIALGGYGRTSGRAATGSVGAAPTARAAGGAQGEVEYLLDTNEPPAP